MKILRRVAIVLVVYIGVIVLFESSIGFFQPANESTLVIMTVDKEGAENTRVLSRLESDGKTYVAANHWPRAWYNQALENPNVKIAMFGATGSEDQKDPYLAVPVEPGSAEHERVNRENVAPFFFRVLTGFPPRYFVRLEPREDA